MNHPTSPLVRVRRILVPALWIPILAGCDQDPTEPIPSADILVEASAAAFAETDPAVGTDDRITVEIRNDGEGTLELDGVELTGRHAGAFSVLAGGGRQSLAAGAVHQVVVAFEPQTEGSKTASLAIASNDPNESRVDVVLTGEAARFRYTQVDRMGIPALNTVFNHPSGVPGFDKTAYNRATPADDVATYRGQFVTVLGAVQNPDPEATADLLLPDELPVSLGASPTAFAALTGRALADDAVDVALWVTVGIPSLQSDNVDSNDRAFRDEFPYVAAPHR